MWKLKQIFDGEYGCEERQPGEKEKCLVIFTNEAGEEKSFAANEDWIAAIEKLASNPLMKIIISKHAAKDCQYKKIVIEKKAKAIRQQNIQTSRCSTIISGQRICQDFLWK